MKEMTTYERISRAYSHQEPDRVPITDWVWGSTIVRWQHEGLPDGISFEDYFGLDNIITIGIDTSPRFEYKLIEETDTYKIEKDEWGVTKKNFIPISATPHYLDCAIKDPQTWQEAKQRMTPSRDRIDWERFKKYYRQWRQSGAWLTVTPWFGYDIINSRVCGTEIILYAMIDNPEWVMDMFNHGCGLSLTLLDMIWSEGYTFDELMWFDDMAYRNGLIFSKDMWREMVRPYQKRTIDWAHSHGIKAHLHCCGNVNELIPDLIELGLDMLNPLEVKAGMDPIQIKKMYGNDLSLRGGFDVQHWSDIDKAEADIRSILPIMMESGGYVFTSDHSIPDSVSLNTYRKIVELVKQAGKY